MYSERPKANATEKAKATGKASKASATIAVLLDTWRKNAGSQQARAKVEHTAWALTMENGQRLDHGHRGMTTQKHGDQKMHHQRRPHSLAQQQAQRSRQSGQ